MQINAADPTTWLTLVVDDDESNRTVISHVLRFYDAIVTEFDGGKKVQDYLNQLTEEGSVNLILLDVQMPEVNGWMVLQTIREHALVTIRQLPVIAVTALAMRGDQERILSAGFTGYLVKPLDPITFIHDLERILANWSAKEIVKTEDLVQNSLLSGETSKTKTI